MAHDFSNESIVEILSHYNNDNDSINLTCSRCHQIFSFTFKELITLINTLPCCNKQCGNNIDVMATNQSTETGLTVNCGKNKNPSTKSTH